MDGYTIIPVASCEVIVRGEHHPSWIRHVKKMNLSTPSQLRFFPRTRDFLGAIDFREPVNILHLHLFSQFLVQKFIDRSRNKSTYRSTEMYINNVTQKLTFLTVPDKKKNQS